MRCPEGRFWIPAQKYCSKCPPGQTYLEEKQECLTAGLPGMSTVMPSGSLGSFGQEGGSSHLMTAIATFEAGVLIGHYVWK